MLLVPSITVINGRTIRLKQGDFTNEKSYDIDPLEVAERFQDHGIRRLHLIDLEGARKGEPVNYSTLELITGHTDLDVNFAGGLHTDGDIIKALEFGAESVTAATIAVYDQDLFANWIMSYGRDKIALGADTLGGYIKVGGWQKDTKILLDDHISYYYERGLRYVKTTDISRDGALEGPSFDLYKHLIAKFPDLCIFASGGIRDMDDIYQLQDIGVYGAIFGKAFYEGKITLKDVDKYMS